MADGTMILVAGALLALGIGAALVAGRLRVPGLPLFLGLGWTQIRPVLVPSLSLATLGTIVTAGIVGLAASWLLGFTTLEGLLLGSIVAATDSAAIFSVLRGSSLNRRVAQTLQGESGFNDPVA